MPTIEESAQILADRMCRSSTGERNSEISLDLIAEYVSGELPAITCYVEQTGGGCATIYLGDSYDVLGVDAGGGEWIQRHPRDKPYGALRPVMAGPGWFAGQDWTHGCADLNDFSIDYDGNDPNPEISGVIVDGWGADPVDEFVIARRMVQIYKDHPRVKNGMVR